MQNSQFSNFQTIVFCGYIFSLIMKLRSILYNFDATPGKRDLLSGT